MPFALTNVIVGYATSCSSRAYAASGHLATFSTGHMVAMWRSCPTGRVSEGGRLRAAPRLVSVFACRWRGRQLTGA